MEAYQSNFQEFERNFERCIAYPQIGKQLKSMLSKFYKTLKEDEIFIFDVNTLDNDLQEIILHTIKLISDYLVNDNFHQLKIKNSEKFEKYCQENKENIIFVRDYLLFRNLYQALDIKNSKTICYD